MKVDSANKVQTSLLQKPKPVEPPKPAVTYNRADTGAAATKLNESNVAAVLKKLDLTNKLPGADSTAKTAAATATKPIDYFEIDKQADELIKKHTESGFLGIGSNLNTDKLGNELAQIAKTDPEKAAALNDNILDKIAGNDKDNLAQSFVKSMSPTELRDFAANGKGKEALEQMKGHLLSGSVSGDDKKAAARIETAIKAAEFTKSPEFKTLSPEMQKEVTSRLDAVQGNKTATDNLINLSKNKDFQSLPTAVQKRMLEAFDKNTDDKLFNDNLIKLAGKSDFKGLSAAQQTGVVADVEKFATTASYKGKEGGIFGIGGVKVGDKEKVYMLNLVGDMSVYAKQNPTLTSVRNSLDKVLDGKIKMEAYSEPAKDGFIIFGNASNNTIRMNMHPDADYGTAKTIDTFVHEINHITNGDTKSGTADRFIDEYRARIVGREAGGDTFDAAMQKEALDTLVKSGAYGHLKKLYEDNPDFAKVIDEAYAGLAKTPPVLTTPEELREKLVAAGFDSDYLKKPHNLDNH
jgi:hypothetical protein